MVKRPPGLNTGLVCLVFSFIKTSLAILGKNSLQLTEGVVCQPAKTRTCDLFPGSLTPGPTSTCDPEHF